MKARALALVLSVLPAAGLTGCDVQSSAGGPGQPALLVAELEARLGERFAEDARVGLDKLELCLKRFTYERRARNTDALVQLLDRNHDALLEVLQAEELRVLGLDLVNRRGEAVERLELEVAYDQGRLEYAWDPAALESLRQYRVDEGLRAELWCESDAPPRGWAPHDAPPLVEGARPVNLGQVLQRGRLRVRLGLTTSGRMVPEG